MYNENRVEDLSLKQRIVLEELLREKRSLTANRERIVRRKTDLKHLPLSFSQQRLWFMHQMDPDDTTYVIHVAVRMQGQLNEEALRKSLNEIARRHESLRTIFKETDGRPEQVILPPSGIICPVVDLQKLNEIEREAEVRRLIFEDAHLPFNLAKKPPLRAKLLRLRKNEHVFFLTIHHIIFDGWSENIFLKELEQLYNSFVSGKLSLLPEPPIQYADYALWQHERLQGEVMERQLAYWKKQLEGVSPVLQMPNDRPRPAVQTYRGAKESFTFSEHIKNELNELSRSDGVTLFMVLLAAFNTLLYRYTGQEDIAIGSAIACRNRPETENLIGFFVNTLVFKNSMSGNPSFKELLKRVRRMTLGAYDHQDFPFESLVKELQPVRDLSYSPLFQVMFVLQNIEYPSLELSGLKLSPLTVDTQIAMFDLTLTIWEGAERLPGNVEYNTDLFDRATIVRMIGHLQTILEGIVANPEQRIAELPLLTEAERHRQLVEWNSTAAEYLRDKCIHELFEEQVKRSPDNVAVVFKEQSLTYRQLNERANQLAHHLRAAKLEPGAPVGICVERSIEMLIGLLGILKAGGAYVPLDPNLPKERLAFICKDIQASILLTQQRLMKHLPARESKVIFLDKEKQAIGREPKVNPAVVTHVKNVAYIIYTSGSTGSPKGVLVPHQALSNHSYAIAKCFDIRPFDRILQFAPFNFDVAAEELYPCLLSGATIVLRETDVLSSFNDFFQFIENKKLSILNLPSSLWHELVAWLSQTQISLSSTVRLVIVGSDVTLSERLSQWKQLVGDRVRLLNAYGPTEATITATLYDMTTDEIRRQSRTVPIGRPISNVIVYVLDAHLQPVPIGVPGELYIGGDGLAKGYLNRPELTAEKFIPNPFKNDPGARLYKTGDMVRYLSDGNLEFLGRNDHQVKLRGYRIELGEIEAAMCEHPGVHQAVAAVKEDSSGEKYIVGYLEGKAIDDSGSPANQIRRFLKSKLPEYMVPSFFVFMQKLPLTTNRKIDRQSLPIPDSVAPHTSNRLPDSVAPHTSNRFVAPQNEIEIKLLQIWKKVLGKNVIGVRDNFFNAGGHSLLAARLLSLIKKEFKVDIQLSLLFQAPTIEALAAHLKEKNWIPRWKSLVPIQPGGSKTPLFLIHAGEGNVLIFRELSKYLGKDQPVYGLQPPVLEDKNPLKADIKELADHYLNEIKSFAPEGPYFMAGYCLGASVAFEMVQQMRKAGEKVPFFGIINAYTSDFFCNLAPNANSVTIPLYRILERAELEFDNLFHLGAGSKIAYFTDRVRKAFSLSRLKLEYILYLLHCKAGLKPYRASFALKEYIFDNDLFESFMRYRPPPCLAKITLFRASQQTKIFQAEPTLGWGAVAKKGIDIVDIKGFHKNILKEPNVKALSDNIKKCLQKAYGAKSGS